MQDLFLGVSMIYLLLAILCTVSISFLMRLSEKYIHHQLGMFLFNYFICIFFSFLLIKGKMEFHDLRVFPIGILTGILFLVNFVFYKRNMVVNGIVLSSTFMKLGVIIPTLMAIFIFHEKPEFNQVLGIVLSVLAILLINYEKDSMTKGNNKIYLILLLLLSGFADGMMNIYDKIGILASNDFYLLITFFSAFLITLGMIIMNQIQIKKIDLLFGALIGIPNYLSSHFLLLALGKVPAILVYPIYSVTAIICTTLIGLFFFKEKLSIKKFASIGLILIALVLLNM